MSKQTTLAKIAILHSNNQAAQALARALRDEELFTEVLTLTELARQLAAGEKILGLIGDLASKGAQEHRLTLPTLNIDFNEPLTQEVIQKALDFALLDCKAPQNWSVQGFIADSIQMIRNQVGDEEVILGLSGGVDSSVVAALIHKAIGKQLTCVFVDNGLLRLNEGDIVMETFAQNMGVNVIRVNAEERFLGALKGVEDPEEKRKIIGALFVEIFEEESKKLSGAQWLAQGTIYPDILESMANEEGKVAVKSHHNVGGLPDEMALQLLEPLKALFKHEVREVGVALGLPREMVYRHPFPGPGLGVRILGEIKKEYADILREADHIFIEELKASDYYDKTSQAFAVFLPIKSVGVSDGARVYDYVIALRAVETVDFMTARAAHLPYELIEHLSNRIINEVKGVSRVVYDISNKPPATIEWE